MRHVIPISGKDSLATALVQLARRPELPYEFFFNDVRAELPETYAWLDKVEAALGRPITRVGRSLEQVIREEGMLPAPKVRFCTRLGKIAPMEEWLGDAPATVYFGIRADEDRVGHRADRPNITPAYPLRELGIDLRGVYAIVEARGLRPPSFFWKRLHGVVAAKQDARARTGFRLLPTAEQLFAKLPQHVFDRLFCWRTRPNCYFCLFQSKWEWAGLLEHHPSLFAKAEEIERECGGGDRREGSFYWHREGPLSLVRENFDRIVARRAAAVLRALHKGKLRENPDDLLQVTSCGLFCGK